MTTVGDVTGQYRVVVCQAPLGEEPAVVDYQPDEWTRDDGGLTRRSWSTGRAFERPPPVPVQAFIDEGEGGVLKPVHVSALWLFSRDVVAVLRQAGVTNLEVFDAEITDHNQGGAILRTHQAVNVVGVGSLEAMHAAGLRCFKLETGGLAVHESVQQALERSGIPMLEFHPLR